MKKIIAIFAVLAMVSMVSATATIPVSAQAQTTAELQAQINNLLNLLAQLQARLSSLVGSTSQNFVFTSNLTVGSTDPQVSRLQMFLVSQGFLTMPPGVAFGYFGPITRSALAQFQASKNIAPAVGFFGPITRAEVNSLVNVAPGTGTGGSTTGITTIGVEGTMSITSNNAGLHSTVYEGEQGVPILGMRLTARQSDMATQRIKINLGNSSTLYNRIISRLYVTDGTNVLASTDLNSNTVIREGGTYYITISGFNLLVPKDSSRNLVIKADVMPSIDSIYRNTSFTLQLANGGVRSVDGAGIDHFDPSTGSSVARSFITQQSLAKSSTLRISLNSDSPRAQGVTADSGADNNEVDQMPVLTFNANAQRDNITITDLRVNVTKSGTGTADATTAYLYDGANQIDNASINAGVATFSNLDYTIPQGTTKTLSIKVDVRNANSSSASFTAGIPSGGITAENSVGDQLNSNDVSGGATGYNISVRNVGPEVALVSKSVSTNGVPQGSNNVNGTSILTASFVVKIRAAGSDLIMGLPGSATPAFDSNSFRIYLNGAYDPTIVSKTTSISYSTPSGATTGGLVDSFRISDGSEVSIPVTFQILGRKADNSALSSGLYSIALDNINWTADGAAQETNFMSGNSDWRTLDVSFP